MKILRSLFVIFSLCTCRQGWSQNLLWDVTDIKADCIEKARVICSQRPVAVTDKQTSRSGDRHNFEALSIYYWPNPDNPDGPYIVRDGEYNPEYKLYDLPRLNTLKHNAINLSKAYYLTNDDKFYEAFVRQIDTWFIDKATRMNPDFEYNQFIPGRNKGKGCPAGLIDAYNFIHVLESVQLVESRKPIGKKRMKALRKWVSSFSAWMVESEIGKGESRATNNHGVAYDVTLFYLSHFTGNQKVCQQIGKEFAEKRINPQIQADGTQPLELKRTKAFSYSVFNLEHLVDFCMMQHRLGHDFLNNEGLRIKAAITYLKQYLGHRELFPYQEIGNWENNEKALKELIGRCENL